jgi:hypothetical protein
MRDLPQDFLLSIFDYNPETGVLTRKKRPIEHFSSKRTFDMYNNKHAGETVKQINDQGYVIAIINGKQYRAHRIAWIMTFGPINDKKIDHINGNRSDNRISNLRACTHTENLRNMRKTQNELPLGVYYDKSRNSYKASIGLGVKGKTQYKRFKTIDDAVAWRSERMFELGYFHLHGRRGA